MDPFKYTVIAHGGRSVCNPLGDDTIARVLAQIPLTAGDAILDVGCGKAEIAIRLAERTGAAFTGVDPNPFFLADARRQCETRLKPGTWDLQECAVDQARLAPAYSAVVCTGASHAFGGFAPALDAMVRLTRPGGWLVIAEGYWKQDPEPAYLAFLDAKPGDYTTHEGNIRLGEGFGLRCVHAATASDAEWDAYEISYRDHMHAWLAANPGDPDHEAFSTRCSTWWAGYQRWGRSTLGFGIYLFRAGK